MIFFIVLSEAYVGVGEVVAEDAVEDEEEEGALHGTVVFRLDSRDEEEYFHVLLLLLLLVAAVTEVEASSAG